MCDARTVARSSAYIAIDALSFDEREFSRRDFDGGGECSSSDCSESSAAAARSSMSVVFSRGSLEFFKGVFVFTVTVFVRFTAFVVPLGEIPLGVVFVTARVLRIGVVVMYELLREMFVLAPIAVNVVFVLLFVVVLLLSELAIRVSDVVLAGVGRDNDIMAVRCCWSFCSFCCCKSCCFCWSCCFCSSVCFCA